MLKPCFFASGYDLSQCEIYQKKYEFVKGVREDEIENLVFSKDSMDQMFQGVKSIDVGCTEAGNFNSTMCIQYDDSRRKCICVNNDGSNMNDQSADAPNKLDCSGK